MYVDEYFQGNMRGQWAGEGYLASTLILLTGVAFTLLAHVHKLPTQFYRVTVGCGALAFVFLSKMAVETAFGYKGFEPAGFFPPSFYERYEGN